MYKRMKSFN